jgi:protease-4
MRALRRILVAIAVVLVLFAVWSPERGPDVADGSILMLDVEGEYVEAGAPPLLSRLLGARVRPFASLLSEIAKAERDERLSAIVFRIRPLEIGWGKAQELREAIRSASSRGRRTAAYLEVESFSANLEYFVASGAQEVYASPASHAALVGLAAEYLFLGGLWEQLGIEFEVEKIGRYKSAAESIAGRSMSDATREMAESLLDSVDEQFVAGIAEGRELPVAAVREAIAAAPVTPHEMQRWGLVDGVLERDALLVALGGGEAAEDDGSVRVDDGSVRVDDGSGHESPGRLVEADEYAAVDPSEVGFAPVATFALVYGSGNVVVGRGHTTPDGSPVLASDTVAEALSGAADDPEIDAIVFRIDSPGGSPLASDIVYRAVERARAAGKPVIASFSDVAASGGYYAAAGADAIVASPASITGSIGVFVLRPVLAGTFGKLGIGFESLTRARHADLQLSTRRLSEASRERLRAEVAAIYDRFVERVASGRELEKDRVDAVAQGRVWTGAQAAERGLVDAVGGLRAAVLEGKRRLDLDEDADVALVIHPAPPSLFEQIDEALGGLRAELALPLPDAVRRARPWLEALDDGTPAALLPFALEIR